MDRLVERVPEGLERAAVQRHALHLAGVIALVVLLVPIFQSNTFATADSSFFAGWQQDSESLVLGKIESTTSSAPPSDADFNGLLAAQPDQMAAGREFDALKTGVRPTTESFWTYPAQLGLQGFLFTGLYHLGADSRDALYWIAAVLSSLSIVAFAVVLGRMARASLAVVFLLATVCSPWMVAAGRNLYWVPFTWFLPVAVAGWLVQQSGRRRKVAFAILFLAFALRWGCGYEFLTSITLLATSMPFLACAFRRHLLSWRSAAVTAFQVFVAAVLAFLVIVVLQALVVGRGDVARGLQQVAFDAAKRTYGGANVTDPVFAASLAANPLSVVNIYFSHWATPVLNVDIGNPFAFRLDGTAFSLLILAATAIVLVRVVQKDPHRARDSSLLIVSIIVPVSWFVLAKGHSYVHPHIDFVLWSLFSLTGFSYIIASFLRDALRSTVIGAARQVATGESESLPPEPVLFRGSGSLLESATDSSSSVKQVRYHSRP